MSLRSGCSVPSSRLGEKNWKNAGWEGRRSIGGGGAEWEREGGEGVVACGGCSGFFCAAAESWKRRGQRRSLPQAPRVTRVAGAIGHHSHSQQSQSKLSQLRALQTPRSPQPHLFPFFGVMFHSSSGTPQDHAFCSACCRTVRPKWSSSIGAVARVMCLSPSLCALSAQ